MPSQPVNPDLQRLLPLQNNTRSATSPTQRSSNRRCPIPPALPIPLRPLPLIPLHNRSPSTYSLADLFTKPDPDYNQSSPSLSPSVSPTTMTSRDNTYPPTRHLTTKPSVQSLRSQHTCSTLSRNLSGQYPRSSFDEIRGNRVCHIESVDGKLVWVGSEVAVWAGDDESGYTELLRGRLISMCDRRKNVAWFVLKDSSGTRKLHFVEVKNQMVKWPLRYKLLTYLDSLRTYIHHIRFGHQLPL